MASACRRRSSAATPRIWSRSCFPISSPARRTSTGAREIPDHPLVQQTLHDCLHEVMDVDGLVRLLQQLEAGEITVCTRDVTSPSPLAHAVLSARPYAFLDDAPAEERRTRAVQVRRFMGVEEAAQLGVLDPAAVARVREQAWPLVRNADELHDALVLLGFLVESEAAPSWHALLDRLIAERRAMRIATPTATLWLAAERLPELQNVNTVPGSNVNTVPGFDRCGGAPASAGDGERALVELLRSRLECLGPVTAAQLGAPLGLDPARIDAALLVLEAEGFAMRGSFTDAAAGATQWCERRLLARIHAETLQRLRKEIEPATPADYVRFLVDWQGLGRARRRRRGAARRAGTPRRFCCAGGRRGRHRSCRNVLLTSIPRCSIGCVRRAASCGCAPGARGEARAPVRQTPITFVPRSAARIWRAFAPVASDAEQQRGRAHGAQHAALRGRAVLRRPARRDAPAG